MEFSYSKLIKNTYLTSSIVGGLGILYFVIFGGLYTNIIFFVIIALVGFYSYSQSKTVNPVRIDDEGVLLRNLFGKTKKYVLWSEIIDVKFLNNKIELILDNNKAFRILLISVEKNKRKDLVEIIKKNNERN